MKLAVKLHFEALLLSWRLKALALAERSWSQRIIVKHEEHKP